MTKEEVKRLYLIWTNHKAYLHCGCYNHSPENKNVCEREKAWRDYCKARDEYLLNLKFKKTKADMSDLFDSFEGME